jgi:superfamily II RNA helicase
MVKQTNKLNTKIKKKNRLFNKCLIYASLMFYLIFSTTTTLSQGVNLPAHCVIIKSTQAYRRLQGFVEYEQATMLQMIGRAGR